MPGHRSRALDRLGRVLRHLDVAPAPLDAAGLAQALRLATALWGDLFTDETGLPCVAARPEAAGAAAVFAACPDAGCEAAGYRAWHTAHGSLFLHYAPIAARALGPDSPPEERAATLLIPDALRLLGDHAAGLGRDPGRYAVETSRAVPFASLVQRTDRLRSVRSSDVNLGAVALALAIESGMRHALDLPGDARLSMWRLFRALAAHADDVRLTVELPLLVAVYNWAGRHRSAGRRGYGWLNYFAADLLHPLFVPPAPLGFGLRAAPDVLARLRVAVATTEADPMHPTAELRFRPSTDVNVAA